MTNWLLEIAGHTVMIGIILYLRVGINDRVCSTFPFALRRYVYMDAW